MPDSTQPAASFVSLASGLHAAPVMIRHDGYQHGIQWGLIPLGARVLLGLPAGELATTIVDLDTLLGPIAGDLVERLRSAYTWTERFLELDHALTSIAGQRKRDGPAPELGEAWQRLTACHGRVAIGALAKEVGWSRRHLGERFRSEFGLTPKVAGSSDAVRGGSQAAPSCGATRSGRGRRSLRLR